MLAGQAHTSDHRRRHRGLQGAGADPAAAGRGAAVTPVLTRAAEEFVTPLSVSALAGEKVYTASST